MINNILKIIPCHRMESRSLKIRGKQMPLCARCTAILLGFIGVPILLILNYQFPLYWGIILQIPMLVDGFTQKWKWRTSNNILRVITGFLSGFGLSILIVSEAFLFSNLILKLLN